MKTKLKFIFTLLSIFAVIVLALFSCRSDKEEIVSQEEKEINPTVLVPKGAAAKAMENLPKKYDLKVCKNDDEVKSEVLKGDWSLAILDGKKAGQLYLQSKKTITAISPIEIDGLKIVQNNYVERVRRRWVKDEETGKMEIVEFVDLPKPNILRGNRIIIGSQKGGIEEDIFNKFLEANEIELREGQVEYAGDSKEFKEAMTNYRQFGLVKEPAASKILEKEESVKTVFDLSSWWQEESGYSIPIKVLIANNDFLKEYKQQSEKAFEAIGSAISDYKESEGAKLVFYYESNRGIRLLESYYEADKRLSEKIDENFYFSE